jgi:hypothetical protein
MKNRYVAESMAVKLTDLQEEAGVNLHFFAE